MPDDDETKGFKPLPVMDLKNKPLAKGDSRTQTTRTIQCALMVLGYYIGKSGVDGIYGDSTENVVKKFQQDNKDWRGNPLDADGKVGELTADALNRKLVGSWFERYQTPSELTKDTVIITATKQAFRDSISVGLTSEH
jgi:peptidoglycan hydrolase-like protein with peptidoglycan-binding domain